MPNLVNTQPAEPGPSRGPVDKAMEVLEALARTTGPQRLAQIARSAGLSKPTVHRHLRTLAEFGFVTAEEGGAYRAGPRLLGLAATALDADPALRLARPLLADLRRHTGHVAYYAVRDADEAVYLEVSGAAQESWTRIRPGGRAPLHRSGPGLAILSALPAEEPAPALPGAGPAADAVREAARLGYAVDDGFGEPDARSLAAPVRDARGHVVGAIGIHGMAFTLGEENVALFGPAVRAAARTIGARLGERTPGIAAATDGGDRG